VRLGCLGRPYQTMAPLPEDSIHRAAARKKRKHRIPPPAKFLESAPNPLIAACRNEPLLEHLVWLRFSAPTMPRSWK